MTSLKEHLKRVRELIEASRNKTGFHEPILNELSALEAAMQRVQQAEREKSQGLREALKAIKNHAKICIGDTGVKMSTTWNIADNALAQFDAQTKGE